MAAKPRQPASQPLPRPLRPSRRQRQPDQPPPPRKSLKQSLKNVFLRRLRKPAIETVGSGILRRGHPETSIWPSTVTSTLFSFSATALTSSQYSLDEYTISRSIPNRFQASCQTPSRHSARQSLLPATSLSHFDLHHAYLQHSIVPQRAVHDALSANVASIASRQASLASLSTFSTTSSVSTLRLQESRQMLRQQKPFETLAELSVQHDRPSSERKPNHVSWLQSPSVSSVSVTSNAPMNGSRAGNEGATGVRLVEHFKLFCILDTAIPGCPVVATSQELRYIFEIGEHFFLNNCECEGTSMDIVTGQDAAGDSVTHLVLFTPLVIPSSGRSRFMLASLIDVTRFIHDAASLPELDKELDSSFTESDLQTPLQPQVSANWNPGSQKLSAEDLLGGCILPDDRERSANATNHVVADDIWLNLANEERRRTPVSKDTPGSTPRIDQTLRASNLSHTTSNTSSTVDDVLEEFMGGLQELYSDFFLLGKSPLNESYFEICNVSPMLYETQEHIHGHLSHTGPQALGDLSNRLAQGSPFNMPVKWGPQALDKRLYCSPMFTTASITWICFLVDDEMPILW